MDSAGYLTAMQASLKETAAKISGIEDEIKKLQQDKPEYWRDDLTALRKRLEQLQDKENLLLRAQLTDNISGGLGVTTSGAGITGIKAAMKEAMAEVELEQTVQTKSISQVTATVWQRVRAGAKLVVQPYHGEWGPFDSSRPTPEPFEWSDGSEASQAGRYIPYLEAVLPFNAREYQLLDAHKFPQLLAVNAGPLYLGYSFSGTTDAVLVLREAVQLPSVGMRLLFELKKEVCAKHYYQVMLILLLANLHSPRLQPVVVLTDLASSYTFFWLDGDTIYFHAASDGQQAMGLISTFLQQEVVTANCNLETSSLECLLPFAKRRKLVMELDASASGLADLEDLADFLPVEEMQSVRAYHWLQQLRNIPALSSVHGTGVSPSQMHT